MAGAGAGAAAAAGVEQVRLGRHQRVEQPGLTREVVALREVLGDVVELPTFFGSVELTGAEAVPRNATVEARGDPPVVVKRPVAKHLEVLRDALARGLGVVKAVLHGHPING